MGLPGLGDVRLGRDRQVGICDRRARPGERHPDRCALLEVSAVRGTAQKGLLWGHAAEGAAFRHGAPHPAVDVCRRY